MQLFYVIFYTFYQNTKQQYLKTIEDYIEMKEYMSKQDLLDTTESFCPLIQNQYTATQNSTLFTQIIQLTAILKQKASHLRQVRLQRQKWQGKQNQQESRYNEIKAQFDYTIDIQQQGLNQKSKYSQNKQILQKDIQLLNLQLDNIKQDLGIEYQRILRAKNSKEDLKGEHLELQKKLAYQLNQNSNIEQLHVNLEDIITINNNQIRKLEANCTQSLIKQTELQSQISTLFTKQNIGRKQLNSQVFKQKSLLNDIKRAQDQIKNTKSQHYQNNCQSQRITMNNDHVKQINSKLQGDLQHVKKHLSSIKQLNQHLNNKLQQYSKTSHKVAKLVIL